MKNNNARQQRLTGNSPSIGHADGYLQPLLLKVKEVTRLLGGVHPRTLSRLEKRGLIRPVSGLLRHKLYSRRDVEALVASLTEWSP